MNKISPRPWKLIKHKDEDCYWLEDVNGDCICDTFFNDDVEHIVKCVNEHDSLVAEVEHLKEILQKPKIDEFSYNKIQQENEQLREALAKCIPFTACSNKANNVCEFCFEKEHTEYCEYIRLTEVEE